MNLTNSGQVIRLLAIIFQVFQFLLQPYRTECKIAPVEGAQSPQRVHFGELALNPEKLDTLLHSAALFALLKAKARALLCTADFPQAESVLFASCAAEAETVAALAKCIVPLMRKRDELSERKRMEEREKPTEFGLNGESDWLGWPNRMAKWLLDRLARGNSEWLMVGDNQSAPGNVRKAKWPPPKKGIARGNVQKEVFQRIRMPSEIGMAAVRSFKHPSRIRPFRRPNSRRWKRAETMVKVNPVELLKRMFQMNARQTKRALKAKAKRMGQKMAEEEPMDLISGHNVPWYMKPVEQLLGIARRWLSGKGLDGAEVKAKRKRMMMKRKKMMRRKEGARRRRRRKRGTEAGRRMLRNIAKLKQVQHFFEQVQHCQRFLDGMGHANSEFFSEFFSPGADDSNSSGSGSPGLRSVHFRSRPSALDSLASELQRVLSNYSFHSFPVLSPRLLSLMPEAKSGEQQPSLFSPTLFSFHNEGIFSLPTLLGLVSTSEHDVVELLDLFMEVAGASRVLDKIVAEIEPRRDWVEKELYPTVLKLEQMEHRWATVSQTFSTEQKLELEQNGYTLMDRQQFRRLYGLKAKGLAISNDAQLEEDIYRMSKMEEGERRARRDLAPQEGSMEPELLFNVRGNSSEDIRSVRPFLFTNKLRQPVAINGAVLAPRAFFSALSQPNFMSINVLSPVAFYASVMSPRAMAASILSPTAFTANVLNPNALWSEVLSPKFFHSNVLSPRALAALVLSPRTMLGEVLSPKLIEARVLNPGTFFISVLGANILTPRVLSPSNFGITVLNPNILSPSILSKGNFTIQVLSPSIMSDDVTPEQLLRGEWQNASIPIGG